MIVINGMPITDGLVNFLKNSYDFDDPESVDNRFDSYADTMLELNDYMIDLLSVVTTDNIPEIKRLSSYLISIKTIKDDLKKLSFLLASCRKEGENL